MVHYAPGTSAQRQRGWRSCRYWVGFRADSFHAIINSLQCGSAWKRATRSCHMQEKVSYAWTASWASSNICFTIPWSWGLGSQNMHALGRFVFFPYFLRFYKTPRCLLQLLFIRPLSLANLCIPGVLSFLCICCVPLHFSMLPRRFSGHSISEQSLLNSWYKL